MVIIAFLDNLRTHIIIKRSRFIFFIIKNFFFILKLLFLITIFIFHTDCLRSLWFYFFIRFIGLAGFTRLILKKIALIIIIYNLLIFLGDFDITIFIFFLLLFSLLLIFFIFKFLLLLLFEKLISVFNWLNEWIFILNYHRFIFFILSHYMISFFIFIFLINYLLIIFFYSGN